MAPGAFELYRSGCEDSGLRSRRSRARIDRRRVRTELVRHLPEVTEKEVGRHVVESDCAEARVEVRKSPLR